MGMTEQEWEEFLKNCSPTVRAINADTTFRPQPRRLAEPTPPPALLEALPHDGHPLRQYVSGVRPSNSKIKLNKTETRYLGYLEALRPLWLGIQCIKLEIGDDCRFVPDFWALDTQGIRAIDVKAQWKSTGKVHIEDDAFVKIKVAARAYPWVRFVLAWPEGQGWCHREINA